MRSVFVRSYFCAVLFVSAICAGSGQSLAQVSSHTSSLTGAEGEMFESEALAASSQVLRGANLFAPEPGFFVSGAFRSLDHAGYDAKNYDFESSLEFSGAEGSVFLNAMMNLASSEDGATILSPYLGLASLDLDFGRHKIAVAGDIAHSGDGHSVGWLGGVRLIQSYRMGAANGYSMLAVGGVIGNSDIKVDPAYSGADPASYGYVGGNASLTGGVIIALSGDVNSVDAGNLKLDLSSTSSWNVVDYQSYLSTSNGGVLGSIMEPWFQSLASTVSARIYTDEKQADGALLRPFAKAGLRYQSIYDNILAIDGIEASFDQARLSAQFDIGVNYITDSATYDANLYTDFSEDYSNVGARLGASFKLN